MTDIHGNQTKWGCLEPDPREGLTCVDCDGKGTWQEEHSGAIVTFTCPMCQGTGRP